ncbi:putative PB1 domain-containing protein [Dioscorea sansibarensis]
METNYSFSSFPDSVDSSPRSREIENENPASWDDTVPTSAAVSQRVKLMVSFGGRIQPRPHDNQLSYVGGDTKILVVDRSSRLPAVLARLSSISGADDLGLKYQLPGEDLDALVSVTNDEDLEHMMLEYDRLCRAVVPGSKAAPRLRLFVFPAASPHPPPAPADPKSNRQWFVDALNNVAAPPPPPVTAVTTPAEGPDFLFGLERGLAPAPAVKTQDPTPVFVTPEPLPVEAPLSRSDLPKDDRPIAVESGLNIQHQIQALQKLQIAENHEQAPFQRMTSDETLTRVYPTDYYLPPRVQEKAPPVTAQIPNTAQIPVTYWPDQRNLAAGGRYTSVAAGDRPPMYLIPATAGMFPPAGASIQPQAGQGFYAAAMPKMVVPPPDVYREAPQMYAGTSPYADGVGGVVRTQGVETAFPAPGQVAYDSAGRPVFFAGGLASYPTATINPEGKIVKPSQVS